METLTRLVTESLARHGFDRPLDYRRLQWSHWFRCESHHSLLVVPSKPGVFALAEEVASFGNTPEQADSKADVETAASAVGGVASLPEAGSRKPIAETSRMLAVAKFFEDDDMAYVLDRMLSYPNPMQARLASGRYFLRFVIIEDPSQRHSVCTALNQWIASSSEKTTGIGSHFATSLELTQGAEPTHAATAAFGCPASPTSNEGKGKVSGPVLRSLSQTHPGVPGTQRDEVKPKTAPTLNSAVATTIHCSSSFPSGF